MAAESQLNPAFSTYYAHRLFMLYQPDDFRMYLGRMADGPNWMRDSARNLDLMAWGTLLVYQARMEPFGFNERLTRLQDERGLFRDEFQVLATPLSLPLYRMQLTLQLAIEAVTRRASIDSRIDEEPARAQLIFDSLYYVAALHNNEIAPSLTDDPAAMGDDERLLFKVTESGLADYLRRHAQGDRGPRLPAEFPGRAQVRFLFGLLHDFLEFLAEPDRIRRETLDYASLLPPENPFRPLWMGLAGAIVSEAIIKRAPSFGTMRPVKEAAGEERSDSGQQQVTPAVVVAGAVANSQPPPANSTEQRSPRQEQVLSFRFMVDQFGYRSGAKSDLAGAREANKALNVWGNLLTGLFGDAATTHQSAGLARILDLIPAWNTTEKALQSTNHLAEAASTEDQPSEAGEIKDRDLRLAAAQLQDYLGMLGRWSTAFAVGLLAASRAATAAPASEPSVRRRIGLRALGAMTGFDPSREPEEVANDLSMWFGSPLAWPEAVRQSWPSATGRPGIVTDPKLVAGWCSDLTGSAAIPEKVAWNPVWTRSFWGQWSFPPGSGIARSSQAPPLNGLDLLHAARHGGIPVMPRLRGTLSIGQWCRLLTVALHEDVPADAVKAATEALGVAEQNGKADEPVLAIFVKSSDSSAWSWRPESGVMAVMPRPPDIVEADRAAAQDRRWLGAETSRIDATSEIRARAASRTTTSRLPGLIICIEEGAAEPDLTVSERALPRFCFGTSAISPGADPYIRSPNGVRDLLRQVKEKLPRPPPVWLSWLRNLLNPLRGVVHIPARLNEWRLRHLMRQIRNRPPSDAA